MLRKILVLILIGRGLSSIIKVENQAGMLPLKLGTAYNTEKEFELVIRKDYSKLFEIWENYKQQGQEITKFGYPVEELKVMEALRKQEEENLEKYSEILQPTGRTKRGALNIVGNIIKAITGNLDEEDGRRYDSQIQELQMNQKIMKTNLNRQLELMENISTHFEKSIKSMLNNQEAITREARKNQQRMDAIQMINHQIFLLEELRRQVEELIQAATFAKAGVLHPMVIEPDILIDSIKKIRLDDKSSFPFEIVIEKLYQIETLIRIKAYQNNQYFVFVLLVPIVNIEPYQYYYISALPIYLGNKTFKEITPDIKFVGIKNQRYIIIIIIII